ncbi:MAG: alcohol dehydrogenase [Flavobacteriaceae bacterium]|nr:alcohol dehydrogenase [Flavobacteriaceae bacterium]|tara:strand:- start:7750 stop:8808 length:1059 start_codon:yes stop_codon:yes gene_type:complete
MFSTKLLNRKTIKPFTIKEDSSIFDAIKAIDQGYRLCLVEDEMQKLIGILTDSDARRAVIKSNNLNTKIKEYINFNPITIDQKSSVADQIDLMKLHSIDQLLVTNSKKVVSLRVKSIGVEKHESSVVLMAGGLGSRLKPLTNNLPKPLLKIQKKTIIERNIEILEKQNFKNIVVSVNYLKELIKNKLGDGKKYGVSIEYISEQKKMGTVGSLKLLKENIKFPLLVMNSDLILEMDFSNLISHHLEQKNIATICVKEVEREMPYGVVKSRNSKLLSIEEKPKFISEINAGVYVFSKQALKYIPKNNYFDAPMLFEKILNDNKRVGTHIIDGRWLDIGTPEDYRFANEEFEFNT